MSMEFLLDETLESSSATFLTSTFTPKKYLLIRYFFNGHSGDDNVTLRVGKDSILDSTGDYTIRKSKNGASDSTASGQNEIRVIDDTFTGTTTERGLAWIWLYNQADVKKQFIIRSIQIMPHATYPAAETPAYFEANGTYDDTTNQMNILEFAQRDETTTLEAGQRVVIHGSD